MPQKDNETAALLIGAGLCILLGSVLGFALGLLF
jgi:hypothetical protein